MKKCYKNILCLLVLSLLLPLVLQDTAEVQAASKRTVRAATEKQLKSALKDSKADVIVFRSGTYKAFTIKSNKAKNKKIIIDAPNAVITNKARFKTVELINAKKYTEAVSGNTIKAATGRFFEVSEGIVVKKLVLAEASAEYSVLKNASVKSVVIADKDHKSTFDKKTRTLTFETTGVWTSFDSDYYGTDEGLITLEYPINYTASLDESGRPLQAAYTGWDSDLRYEYIYDENGRCTELKQYNGETGILELTHSFEYDHSGNIVTEKFNYSYEPFSNECNYTYDANGILTATVETGKYHREETGYFYDDNGLLIKKETTKFMLDNDKLSSRKSWTDTYTYNKYGFLLTKVDYYIDDHFSYLYTYEYDKAGNMIHEIYTYENLGNEVTSEKSFEYDELGRMIRQI